MHGRKKYAMFEQEWFQHIHEYMKEESEQSGLWKTVHSFLCKDCCK